jgi:hypothetical protein
MVVCRRKSYIFQRSAAKPIPFMAPNYVSVEVFTAWQAQASFHLFLWNCNFILDVTAQIENIMEVQYELARLVSPLQAESLKDMLWRSWKAKVISALDATVATMEATVRPLGLTVKICHSANKRGATIYLESSRPGRMWQPLDMELSPLRPADLVPAVRTVAWPSGEFSPENARRLQQIIWGGLPSVVRVRDRRLQEIPYWETTVRATATSVPLCSLPIYNLMCTTWTDALPRIDEPQALAYRTLKYPYDMCRSAFKCTVVNM